MATKNKYLPLMIDLDNKKIVIIGSGKVARRKAKFLSDYGVVEVIAKNFDKKFEQLKSSHSVKLIKTDIEELSDKHLTEIFIKTFLTIPATADPLLNQKIARLAKQSGSLVNQVDSVGEVIFPSVVTQGEMVIGISTNGNSPALSRFTRKKLARYIIPEYADMSRLQNEMREFYKNHIDDQKIRKQYLWEILNDEKIWSALSESYDKALSLAKTLNPLPAA